MDAGWGRAQAEGSQGRQGDRKVPAQCLVTLGRRPEPEPGPPGMGGIDP